MGTNVSNKIFKSTNGSSWTQYSQNTLGNEGQISGHQIHVFQDKMQVVGGFGANPNDKFNKVWNSIDGENWTYMGEAAFEPRIGHSLLVFKQKMWTIAGTTATGQNNDIWNSADGIIWKLVTSDAGFPLRSQHASIVHNNRMWVVAGADGLSKKNDVY